jgi:hypothetical protein
MQAAIGFQVMPPVGMSGGTSPMGKMLDWVKQDSMTVSGCLIANSGWTSLFQALPDFKGG